MFETSLSAISSFLRHTGLGLVSFALLGAIHLSDTAGAQLLWYDGFAIDGADDGAGPNYVAGSIFGQRGGSDAGSGIGFFDDGAGDPNPWEPANAGDPAADDSILTTGSLKLSNQSLPSSGDRVSDLSGVGCCATSRTGRQFNSAFSGLDETIYMGFLVNFGLGNPADPHYRAVEFWDGGVGDGFLNMSLGFSSFGNYDDPVNDADGPGGNTANRQLSVRVDGVREEFGSIVQTNHQLEEHLEFADQVGHTHSVVLKFELSTQDRELSNANPGDSVSVFLNPSLTDVTEPAPSLVVSGVDLNLDRMSNIILFHFTGTNPANPGSFDELRVGRTWGDVAILVPEPGTAILVLAAVGMLTGWRRRND
jgi:hypothetical protein